MSLGLQRVSGSRPHRRSREADAAVVLADVDESAVRAEAETLVGAGHTALAIRCDVSDDAAVAAMVDRTVAELGRLDTAFNNAEVMARITPLLDAQEARRDFWDEDIDTLRLVADTPLTTWSAIHDEAL